MSQGENVVALNQGAGGGLRDVRPLAAASLKGGGGDGTSGDMEDRVKRLEADVGDLKKQVGDMRLENIKGFGDIKTLLSTIDERTKDIPSMGKALATLDERTKDVASISKIATTLEERTKHMPTRWEVIGIIAGVVTLAATILGIARWAASTNTSSQVERAASDGAASAVAATARPSSPAT